MFPPKKCHQFGVCRIVWTPFASAQLAKNTSTIININWTADSMVIDMNSHHLHITGSASPPNWYLFVDSSSTRNWDLVWTASSARDEVVPPLCAWCSCSDSKKLPACELIRLFSTGMVGDLHPSLVELQAKRFWRLEECLG